MNKIDELKSKYQSELENYGDQVKEYTERYGYDRSEYLQYRLDMCHYYRGAYNALIELEKT